jgi:lysophospholipase L1-like esterase
MDAWLDALVQQVVARIQRVFEDMADVAMSMRKLVCVSIVVLCSMAVGAGAQKLVSRHKPLATIHAHQEVRDFIIRSQTVRAGSAPVIVVGDSITETSELPSTLCEVPVINAGIGGVDTTYDFAFTLRRALDGRKARLIVVALGSNDIGATDFSARYVAALEHLKPYADAMLLVNIPPQATASVAEMNQEIATVAAKTGLPVVDFHGALDGIPTLDGLHLTAQGYAIWERAVEAGIQRIVGACSGSG